MLKKEVELNKTNLIRATKAFIIETRFCNCWCDELCEFVVVLDGKAVFKDAVYARTVDSNVIVRDVLGETKKLVNCRIIEVDVSSTQLMLSSVQSEL